MKHLMSTFWKSGLPVFENKLSWVSNVSIVNTVGEGHSCLRGAHNVLNFLYGWVVGSWFGWERVRARPEEVKVGGCLSKFAAWGRILEESEAVLGKPFEWACVNVISEVALF